MPSLRDFEIGEYHVDGGCFVLDKITYKLTMMDDSDIAVNVADVNIVNPSSGMIGICSANLNDDGAIGVCQRFTSSTNVELEVNDNDWKLHYETENGTKQFMHLGVKEE
jgi:hypothetical protein